MKGKEEEERMREAGGGGGGGGSTSTVGPSSVPSEELWGRLNPTPRPAPLEGGGWV